MICKFCHFNFLILNQIIKKKKLFEEKNKNFINFIYLLLLFRYQSK